VGTNASKENVASIFIVKVTLTLSRRWEREGGGAGTHLTSLKGHNLKECNMQQIQFENSKRHRQAQRHAQSKMATQNFNVHYIKKTTNTTDVSDRT
jgi:hypothetical protein